MPLTPNCRPQCLRDADWTLTDLHGRNLKGYDFSNSRMYRANLAGTDLTGATLVGTQLSGADLTGANLTKAAFVNANLNGVKLNGAKLNNASLYGTDMYGADLTDADMSGADMTYTILFEATWGNTICPDGTKNGTDKDPGYGCIQKQLNRPDSLFASSQDGVFC